MNPREPWVLKLVLKSLADKKTVGKLKLALCGIPVAANSADLMIDLMREGVTRELDWQEERAHFSITEDGPDRFVLADDRTDDPAPVFSTRAAAEQHINLLYFT